MSTRNGRLPRVIWLGLVMVVVPSLALVALQVWLAVVSEPQRARTHAGVVHTLEVITTVTALRRAMGDAERGQRGFLLTEQEAYLEPYREGVARVPELLSRLRELTADNAEQQRRMPNLEHEVSTKLAEMKRTLEVRDSRGVAAARAVLRDNVGLDTMEAISGLLDAAVANERELLEQRQARAQEEERSASRAAWASSALAFLITTLGAILVLWTFRDLRRADDARHASEERLRVFVEGVTDYAVCALDPGGNIVAWNAGAERILGYAASEVLGRHFSQFFLEEDKAAGVPKRALEVAAREGTYEAELGRERKDGSRFMAEVLIGRVLDPSGKLAGFTKVTRDVTARIAQKKALEQATAALAQSQKMETLGQLSGGIAHDFNNFLHIIRNALDALRRRGASSADPEVATFLEMAGRSVDRATSLTQRILAYARRQPLDPVPLDPNKLVRGMAELLGRTLGESVAIETVLGGGVWWIAADTNQLETAVLNLALNARDAMPGGGKLTIETSNAFLDDAYAAAHEEVTPGQYVMIALSDTGQGMTKEIAARAFEPFFTTKEVGRGTGLGLSQVFGFIKQSGGHVKLYSEPGAGTTVKLYLPRLDGAEASAPKPDVRDADRAAGKTIVLVEDDDDVRAFTAEMLGELGYRVLAAPEAASALRLLEENAPVDLLFTDVGLPGGMNGRKLADEARRRWPELPVLFTTGYARNAIVHHGRLDPGVQLIVKPFTQAEVAAKIKHVLEAAGPRE